MASGAANGRRGFVEFDLNEVRKQPMGNGSDLNLVPAERVV